MRSRKWLRDVPLVLRMIVSGVIVFSSTQVSGAPRPTLKPAPVVGGSSTVLNDTDPGSVREAPKAAARPKVKEPATTPNSSHFTRTSRSAAYPNVIGCPFARTTRIPVAIRPSVFPLVRVIISGA